MPTPDWDDPAVEADWFAGQRSQADEYMHGQRALFGSVETQPAWAVAPYVAIWRALGSRSGEPAYWVITGDLPTDFLPSSAADSPRAAATAFAERWRSVAGYMLNGRKHPTITIGSGDESAELGSLLQSRADTIANWALNDDYW